MQDSTEQRRRTRDPWEFQRWAYEQVTGSVGRKAVLSMLAMMADAESGRCEAKVTTLARGAELSERAIQGHLRGLEADGLIARRPQYRRDGSQRGSEFLLLAPGVGEWPDGQSVGGADSAPPRLAGRADLHRGGEASFTGGVKPASGQERPLENGHRNGSSSTTAREWAGVDAEMRHDAEALLKAKTKVNSRAVTEAEMEIAACALAEFNRQASSDYGLGAHLRSIVMRVRERPSATADHHVRLVQSAWRIRWWERNGNGRKATPAVVYGERCFENVWQDAVDEARGTLQPRALSLKERTYSGGRKWDELTANEQAAARENASMGIFPGDDRKVRDEPPASSEPWNPEPLTAENF